MHLIPIDAAFLMEEETHYIIMRADELSEEIEAIFSAAETTHPHGWHSQQQFAPKIQECALSVLSLLDRLPHLKPPKTRDITEALLSLPESRIYPLKYACRQSLTNIQYIRTSVSGRDFSKTECFLVSPLWRRRVERTLGGELFPAYVGHWTFLNEDK